MIYIPPYIESLKTYKAGKPIEELARERNLTRIVKLASNENPLGPSPKAIAAVESALGKLHRYVDPLAADLVNALARKYDVRPEHIVTGHGTDALLAYAVGAFSEPGDELLTCAGSFIGIYVSTLKQGRVLKKIPLKDYAFDLDAILDAVTPRTRIIFLANPNNPTGTMFNREALENFMSRVPDDVLVILDEAYYTYAERHPGYPQGVSYWYDNMVVMRTLSKAYGLGGLRIGFAVGPDRIINALYKMKLPFEPNLLAQVAAAAALDDDDFLEKTVKTNERSLAAIRKRLTDLGIRYVDSVANFIMMLMPSEEFAASFFENCLHRGLILRHVAPFGVPEGVRINSGTDDETAFAMNIIEQVWTERTATTRTHNHGDIYQSTT